jgi:6-phosphogluconolactonase
MHRAFMTSLLLPGLIFFGCGGSRLNSPPPVQATIQSIQVILPSSSMGLGTSAQLGAKGAFSDGTTRDVTSQVFWSSNPEGMATISSSGLLTARIAGDVTIQATAGTVIGNAVLSITAPTPGFLSVTTDRDGGLWAYRIDPSTGTLTPTGNIAHVGGLTVAASPDGTFVYAAGGGVSVARLDKSTGTLSLATSTLYESGGWAFGSMVIPDGKFYYVSSEIDGVIRGYVRDQLTGLLSVVPGSPFPAADVAGVSPFDIVVSADSKTLYVSNMDGQSVGIFSLQNDGSLIQTGLQPLDGKPGFIALDPVEPFMYVCSGAGDPSAPNSSAATISAFAINADGTLKPLGHFENFSGLGPMAIDPSGRFLYLIIDGGTQLLGLAIDENSGALTPMPGSPFPLDSANRLHVDPSGRFLYVSRGNDVDATTWQIVTFRIDPMTGVPQQIQSLPVGFKPVSFAITVAN